MPHDTSEYILTSEVARILGVSGQTIRAWDRSHRLIPAMRAASGLRLYARADIDAMRRRLLDEQRTAESVPASA